MPNKDSGGEMWKFTNELEQEGLWDSEGFWSYGDERGRFVHGDYGRREEAVDLLFGLFSGDEVSDNHLKVPLNGSSIFRG